MRQHRRPPKPVSDAIHAGSIPFAVSFAALCVGVSIEWTLDAPELDVWARTLAAVPLITALALRIQGRRIGALKGVRNTFWLGAVLSIALYFAAKIPLYFISPELGLGLVLAALGGVMQHRRVLHFSAAVASYGLASTAIAYTQLFSSSLIAEHLATLGAAALCGVIALHEYRRENAAVLI